ncbi:MAG: hypothetical protein ACFE9S_15585 [Candidatus Hermodarchaeota archaeon]
MTQFIPTNFRKQIKQKLDEIEILRKFLDPDEIEKIIPKFLKFYEDPENEAKIFNDGFRDWIILQTPEKSKLAKTKEAKSDFSEDNHLWICKFKLGQLNVFGTLNQMKELGWNSTVLTTGKLNIQYKLIGQKEYYKTLETLVKDFNLEPDRISKDDYVISYSYNLYQLIERL